MPPLSSPGGVATLGEIGDVDLAGLADGDGIVFDSGLSEWNSGSPQGGFYVLGGEQAGGAAGGYTSNGLETNPENVSGSQRQDIWWRDDGLKVFTLRGESPRISQYDVFPAWSITFGDWTPGTAFTSIPIMGTNKFGMQFNPNGFEVSMTNTGGSGLITVFPLSVAFDSSTIAAATSSFLLTSGATRHHWHPNLMRFWVQQGNDIKEYSVSSSFFVSGATLIQTFDVNPDAGSINGWTFSFNGLFLYANRTSGDKLVSWQMSTPYDLSTITVFDGDNGPDLNPSALFNSPEGFYFRETNGDLIMGDATTSGASAQRMQSLSL